MQKENEKISGIMADKNMTNSNIENMIERLRHEITSSNENMKFCGEPMVQSSSYDFVKGEDQDIDDEITELENIIKKLQAEIVEMTQSANKPIPVNFCPLVSSEGGTCCMYAAKNASPEILNDLKEPERGAGFPNRVNDEDLLKEVKMFAESLSNLMKSTNITSEQKEALSDVKWNFSTLWENADKSNRNNIEIAEKTLENIGNNLSKAFDYCIMHSSLDTDESSNENPISIESTIETSMESSSVKAEINRCDEVSEFFSQNDTVNDTCEYDKITSCDIDNSEDLTVYDVTSGFTNENSADDSTLNNAPIMLNSETPNNLPNEQVNEVNIEDEIISEDTTRDLPKPDFPDTVEVLKATILETSDILSHQSSTPELSQIIPLPTPSNIPETQTPSVTPEAVPKSDSIFKSINRKIRKMVGRDSEKAISRERHTENSLINKNISKEFMKAFPRCKSEPKKCEDSNQINPNNNFVVLTQGSNVNNYSIPMNKNKSYPETNSIRATESSKQTIPEFLSNVKKTDYTDHPETVNRLDSASANPPLPEADSNSKNYLHSHLTTTENTLQPINTPNGPQLMNTDNVIDNPTVTKKSLEQGVDDSAGRSSGATSSMPKLFGSDLNTDGQNIIKEGELSAETGQADDEGEDEDGHDVNVMKAELDSGQDNEDEDVAGEEDEQGDEEGDDDDDDDDDTYDVD